MKGDKNLRKAMASITDAIYNTTYDVGSERETISPAGSGDLITRYERTEAQLAALITASRNLFKKRSFNHMARSIFDLARPAVGAAMGFVAMIDEETSKLQMVSLDIGPTRGATSDSSHLLELSSSLIKQKKPFFTNDFQTSSWSENLPPGLSSLDNLLVCPLLFRKKTVGIISMINKPGGFDENDLNITQTFCQLLTISLANTRSWEATKASEERFRQFFNNEPNYCLISSPEGLILDVNAACLAVTEYDRDELLKKPWWTIYDRESQNWIKEQSGSQLPLILNNRELQICSVSGKQYHVLVTTSVNRDENGNPLHYVTVLIDITKRVHVEKEQHRLLSIYQDQSMVLSESNAQLEIALTQVRDSEKELQKLYEDEKTLRDELQGEIKKRTDFMNTLVHELKTPLVPLVASSNLLTDGLDEEPWRSIAHNIERGATNLSQRIEELLDAAKGEAGSLSIELSEVNPLKLLDEVTSEISDLINVRRLHLKTSFPADMPMIKADQVRLHQVLANICNNAIKYTPEGGDVTINAAVKAKNLTISVHDTGLGIPSEDIRQLFQSYFRASNSRYQYHGMGVGLFLCKKIMELHGGDITVTSEEGKGSVFTIIVPILQTTTNGVPDENKRCTILIAESDTQTLDAMTVFLKEACPETFVFFANTGRETIDLCRREKIDGLILGLEFPDIDGLEVLKEIRQFNNVPAVLISSAPREDVRDSCLELGITAYYVKPIDTETVISRLKTRMEQRKQYTRGIKPPHK